MNDVITGHYEALDEIAAEMGASERLTGVSDPRVYSRPPGRGPRGAWVEKPSEIDAAVDTVRAAGKQIDDSVAPVLEGKKPARGSDELAVAQGGLTSSLATAALTVDEVQEQLKAVGEEATTKVQRLINWLLEHVIRVISKVAGALHVDNWTVGVSGGFPAGMNLSITITFK
jgi:hypothetical protein